MTTVPKRLHDEDQFALEKTVFGGITLLTMRGTLDHAFEGRKIADAIRTKKVIVDMRDVRRFASWGMSEWMDFLRINAKRDLYLIECSTYAISQINLVTGLLGHGKLVSFYASFRCGSCSEEVETQFLIPRDRASIRDLPGSDLSCMTCGGRARLEEYPAAFFDAIADRPPYDIDDEVLALLRSSMGYDLAPDLARFRAFRRIDKRYTYLRLSGTVDLLPAELLATASQGTTVVDLKDIVFDPAQLGRWLTYVQTALPKLSSLQLINCPSGFLEHAVRPEDLHDKLKVRTFALPYDCLRCNTTTDHMVDVAENLEQLAGGTPPTVRCTTCQFLLVANLSPSQKLVIRSLPARDRELALDKFLAKARAAPADDLENCLVATSSNAPVGNLGPVGNKRTIYLALGLAVLMVGGLGIVGWGLWRQQGVTTPVADKQTSIVPRKPPPPSFERPDWILSDVPSSAYCHDMINRLMCIGVSSYRPTREAAVAEANDAALEELVSAVGLKISDSFFRETVMAGYSEVRAAALSALQAADMDRKNAGSTAADDVVGKARKRVVEILRASGGAAVPTQRSDWHWEEYAAKAGGTEVLVFVRYDVTLDAVKALVDKYSASTPVMGSTVMTAFPALAWQDPDFTGGAMLTKVGRTFSDAGVASRTVVTGVGEQRVGDATGFTRLLEEWKQGSGDLKLTVKTAEAAARVVELPRQRVK